MSLRDRLFENNDNSEADFTFNESVSGVFDDMLHRSVPFYDEVQRMTAELAAGFYQKNSYIYDLGCSLGTLVSHLKKYLSAGFSYRGIDLSEHMLNRAREKYKKSPVFDIEFLKADATGYEYSGASVIVASYFFQFVRPLERVPLMRRLYAALRPGGILIISEKVLESDSDLSRLFLRLYFDFKKRNGYSDLEISKKREALENVLVPYRLEENLQLLADAGFTKKEIFFKWYNFASVIAVKES